MFSLTRLSVLYIWDTRTYDLIDMTSDEFREIALSFPETEERSHMEHPDFRVGGKIFATLGPDLDWGMAKLSPAEQQEYLRIDPANFKPAAGKWGEGGATIITLADADEADVRAALAAAWRNTAPKNVVQKHPVYQPQTRNPKL